MRNGSLSETQIDKRLELLGNLARARREANVHRLFGDPGCERYLRISSSGYRLVSLATRNPCGAVLLDGRVAGSVSTIDAALRHLAVDESRVAVRDPKKPKPEHEVQAFLMRGLLTAPAQAPKMLDCEGLFDELHLVTDEFAIDNSVRADLLMLGRRTGQQVYVPVFLELKAKRDAALKEQLANIKSLSLGSGEYFAKTLQGQDEQAASEARKGAFEAFLKAATGISAPIDLSNGELIAVWPLRKSEPGQFPAHASVKTMLERNIHRVGFKKQTVYSFSLELP